MAKLGKTGDIASGGNWGHRLFSGKVNGYVRYEYGEKVRYTDGLEIDNLISMTQSGGNTHFFHQDGLGSTVNLSNSQGNKVSSYGYDIFGSIRSQSGSVHTPFLFTGRELDKESGLYYYRARYMDAGVGRFRARDPKLRLELEVKNLVFPQELHPYAYCGNNPVNYVDPEGESQIQAIICLIPELINLAAIIAYSIKYFPGSDCSPTSPPPCVGVPPDLPTTFGQDSNRENRQRGGRPGVRNVRGR